MKHAPPLPRKRPSTITTISPNAPWITVSAASHQSGVSQKVIRSAGLITRKFGNADYVSPQALNDWILGGEGK